MALLKSPRNTAPHPPIPHSFVGFYEHSAYEQARMLERRNEGAPLIRALLREPPSDALVLSLIFVSSHKERVAPVLSRALSPIRVLFLSRCPNPALVQRPRVVPEVNELRIHVTIPDFIQ